MLKFDVSRIVIAWPYLMFCDVLMLILF